MCALYILYLWGGFENADQRLSGLAKVSGSNPSKETFEDILLCEFFAMDHQYYALYGPFQHVNLQSLRRDDKD